CHFCCSLQEFRCLSLRNLSGSIADIEGGLNPILDESRSPRPRPLGPPRMRSAAAPAGPPRMRSHLSRHIRDKCERNSGRRVGFWRHGAGGASQIGPAGPSTRREVLIHAHPRLRLAAPALLGAALLALVLLVAGHATAKPKPSKPKPTEVKVMTRNVY